MKTDKFIQVLVADERPATRSLGGLLLLALAAGFAVAAIPYWYVHGPRPDIAAAMSSPRFLFKVGEVLLIAAAAWALVLRLVRPGADARPQWIGIAVPLLLLAAAVAVELYVLPSREWKQSLFGDNYYACLVNVFLLSLPLLAAALYALKAGAPVRPALAGGIAGLLAGGIAAAIYAVQCTDDSPLFVATWYVLAITAAGVVGAFAGSRILRW